MHGTCSDTERPVATAPRDGGVLRARALATGERYGFELVRELSAVDGLVTSEGTIYPLLTRLRKDELVTTFWQESESGPPRYYQLTVAGHAALGDFTKEWSRFRDSVDTILERKEG